MRVAAREIVTAYPAPIASIPGVPWQLTGNHWLAIPCVHPADGAIHAIGLLHRGSRSAIEFAGGPKFVEGDGPPLLRPVIRIDDVEQRLSAGILMWEQALGWLPTFTAAIGDGRQIVRGTIFAPVGRDADVPGAVYVLSVENRADTEARVEISLEGLLGHRQQRVRSARAYTDRHRVVAGPGGSVLLDGAELPGSAALAIAADGSAPGGGVVEGVVTVDDSGPLPRFVLTCETHALPGTTVHAAFYVAAAPERDGAAATVLAMRRRGWQSLLSVTREGLRSLEQTTGSAAVDRLVNRNLLFAYFYGTGRAIDDARFYLVRSRAPWNGRGVTVRDWDALTWTVPAVQLADAPLARELILRACEVHGNAPGRGVHYLDGSLFEPGFSIEGVGSFAWAVERYIRETGDTQVVEEPVLADTLYAAADDLSVRRHADIPLYSTEVYPSGVPVPYPYTLHGNAVAALALDVLRRTLDAETAKKVEDPSAVRAAILRHFSADRDGKTALVAATDLRGAAGGGSGVAGQGAAGAATSVVDDDVASVLWLPLYETLDRQDSAYRRTVKAIPPDGPTVSLVRRCARLVGPDAGAALAWLRSAPLDNGLAAELLDADGRAIGNGGDAALAGLVAYAAWYAVHGLGVTP